ncbi:hypothetical protein [Serinibacter salmoneus]|uniref:Uncharacterized protein n=1 Tax=Serinibacter salmoneus TaxID=556530 RepID=A0A2A9D046_9MICO|nr:hypothetical protein [Serinibacter salmoneus]PFG19761.1 hypothetical protein ATL40_1331 [Serinibacter salmoneus]
MARRSRAREHPEVPAYGTPEPFLGEPRAVPVAADDLPVDPPPRSRERVVWIRELVSRPLVSTSPWVMVTAVLATLIGFVPLAVPGVVLAGRAAVGPRGVRDRAWSLAFSLFALGCQAGVIALVA